MRAADIKMNLPCGAWLILRYNFCTKYGLSAGEDAKGWELIPDLVLCRSKRALNDCPWVEATRQFFVRLLSRKRFVEINSSGGKFKPCCDYGEWDTPVVLNDDPRFRNIPFVSAPLKDSDAFDMNGDAPYKGQRLIRNPKLECPHFGKSFDPSFQVHKDGIIEFVKRIFGFKERGAEREMREEKGSKDALW